MDPQNDANKVDDGQKLQCVHKKRNHKRKMKETHVEHQSQHYHVLGKYVRETCLQENRIYYNLSLQIRLKADAVREVKKV